MNTKELGGGVFAVPTAGATVRPDPIDEIVGDRRIQEIKQRHGAGGRKAGRSEFMPVSLPLETHLVSDNAKPRNLMRMNPFESRLQKLS